MKQSVQNSFELSSWAQLCDHMSHGAVNRPYPLPIHCSMWPSLCTVLLFNSGVQKKTIRDRESNPGLSRGHGITALPCHHKHNNNKRGPIFEIQESELGTNHYTIGPDDDTWYLTDCPIICQMVCCDIIEIKIRTKFIHMARLISFKWVVSLSSQISNLRVAVTWESLSSMCYFPIAIAVIALNYWYSVEFQWFPDKEATPTTKRNLIEPNLVILQHDRTT